MAVFQNNSFYPQHFFIPYDEDTSIYEVAKQIADEAVSLEADFFDGKTSLFDFKLMYHPPFVSSTDFPELKKLQRAALRNTRFKSEYNGYICVDITEWIDHCDEEHFINCLAFLGDMSDNWKYIFYTGKHFPEKALDNMLNAIKKHIWTVIPDKNAFVHHEITDILQYELSERSHKRFSESCLNMLKFIFSDRKTNDNSFIDRFVNDVISFYGRADIIDSRDMQTYLTNNSTFGAFAMTVEEVRLLNSIIELGR